MPRLHREPIPLFDLTVLVKELLRFLLEITEGIVCFYLDCNLGFVPLDALDYPINMTGALWRRCTMMSDCKEDSE